MALIKEVNIQNFFSIEKKIVDFYLNVDLPSNSPYKLITLK